MAEDDREICGTRIRGIALFVDGFVWVALLFLAWFYVGFFTGDLQTIAAGGEAQLAGVQAVAALLVLWFAFVVGYHAVAEWRWGQTLGKYLTGIEVQRSEGGPIGLRAAIVRNVLRAVDLFPLFPVLGPMFMATSETHQRFGDRVAGTVVVRSGAPPWRPSLG